jgi:type III pantothenate kinase
MGEAEAPVGRIAARWRLIDVGNTHVKQAAAAHGRLGSVSVLRSAVPIDSNAVFSGSAERIAIASVNPPILDGLLRRLAEGGVIPTVVLQSDGSVFSGGLVTTDVERPDSTGVDRVLGCLGAIAVDPGRTAVVVDCGTATTVNVMTTDRCFRGGLIMPGRGLASSSLRHGTASLPDVRMETSVVRIGKSTRDSLRFGINAGFFGSIERSVAAALREHPDAQVYLTGGDSEAAHSAFPRYLRREWLTLTGLYWYATHVVDRHE